MRVPEELIHCIWQHRLYASSTLTCQHGQQLAVISPGQYHQDAGPDFLFAHIQMDGQAWHGHVEIHVLSSDWQIHHHEQDPAYNSVILHVVWKDNGSCYAADGAEIPTLELSKYVNHELLRKAHELLNNSHWIPCAYQLKNVPIYIKVQAMQRMAIERLEIRYEQILDWLKQGRGDWERVTLMLLASSFGMRVNKASMIDLSQIISLKLIQKLKHQPLTITSLFFGQAGFLTAMDLADPYVKKLKIAYEYLKRCYQLKEMSLFQWKFLRMRPGNFPTFKLAQLCGMYMHQSQWFSTIVEAKELTAIFEVLQQVHVHSYWETHYHFLKISKGHETQISSSLEQALAINCFAPLRFAYAKHRGDLEGMAIAIQWLEAIAMEENVISKRFRKAGMPCYSALESQGLLQLRAMYCEPKKCLQCPIGLSILKR
ncbi:DUF2851 family protein [Sphingobacterium sp. HJSM2_6]|uniref:DUF2851 family protein n=1 Tax=Sphingobacterium sp. HJSM2_6 TaxID=3366264 RepID=UPI003BBEA8AC